MRIIFMGTPDFAVPCLEKLIKSDHEIVAVFTQPDKKKGRGYAMSAPPVKELALKHEIQVFQPATLKTPETLELISSLNPDLIVVVAYGKILPSDVLNSPKFGCINVHGSLLPKYRGAAPIQWAVINGEKTTGITTMYMNEELDTGDIILTAETEIGENETSGELFERLSVLGAELLMETLCKIEKDKEIHRTKQDDCQATYAPMLDKTLSRINWTDAAQKIHNLVRGLNPWPVATSTINGKSFKIYKTKGAGNVSGQPGEVKSVNPFIVACGDNSAIEILELQMESKKRMNSTDFLGVIISNNGKLERLVADILFLCYTSFGVVYSLAMPTILSKYGHSRIRCKFKLGGTIYVRILLF